VDLLDAVRRHVCLITRLRLDANLFAPRRRVRRATGPDAAEREATAKTQCVLTNRKTVWTRVVVSQWYNARNANC